MSSDELNRHKSGVETLLTHGGRELDEQLGFVNTPVFRGSTVLYKSLDELEGRTLRYDYGRTGNPSTRAVEDLVTQLEGAAGTVLAPSGLAAISVALLSALSSGDEFLVTDSAYEPTRLMSNDILSRLGIGVRYYDPRIGAGIADLIGPNTRAIFVESPGSHTFEVQDLPAIAKAAHAKGASVIVDNSWATPLYYRPLDLGADIVVHAGTKMFVGHSDAMFGTISANAGAWERLKLTHRRMGICASPDDAFLAARGLRTLAIRMKEHSARGLALAGWLEQQPEVLHVLHPGLPSHPDHALFQRDFTGSGSVFSVIFKERPRTSLAAMVDNFALFGMGYSWGGYESLFLPTKPHTMRTAVPWTQPGQLARLHVGFEDLDDLKADLRSGLDRYMAG